MELNIQLTVSLPSRKSHLVAKHIHSYNYYPSVNRPDGCDLGDKARLHTMLVLTCSLQCAILLSIDAQLGQQQLVIVTGNFLQLNARTGDHTFHCVDD